MTQIRTNLSNHSFANEAIHRIRKDILEGEFEMGQRLVEMDLADRYNMSRTPIREALLQLRADGLVMIETGRGACVRSYTAKDLKEIYGIRTLLESYAARLAATRITKDQIDALIDICDSMESVPSADHDRDTIRSLVIQNNRFHHIVWETAANERLNSFLQLVAELPLTYKSYFWYTPRERARAMRYHRELVSAFQNMNPQWAESIMKSHVLSAQDYLIQVMTEQVQEEEQLSTENNGM